MTKRYKYVSELFICAFPGGNILYGHDDSTRIEVRVIDTVPQEAYDYDWATGTALTDRLIHWFEVFRPTNVNLLMPGEYLEPPEGMTQEEFDCICAYISGIVSAVTRTFKRDQIARRYEAKSKEDLDGRASTEFGVAAASCEVNNSAAPHAEAIIRGRVKFKSQVRT